jgi:hypothetical protein
LAVSDANGKFSWTASPTVSGANITSLNAGNLSTGTVPQAQLPTTMNAANLGGATLNATNLSGQLPALNGSALTALSPVSSPLLQRTLWTDGIVANSGTSETLISSNQIPAGTLAVGGMITYTLTGTNDSVAATRTVKIYGGASSGTAATISTVSKAWTLHITFSRISTSVVDCYAEGAVGSTLDATTLVFTDTGNWGTTPQLIQATITSSVGTGDVNVRSGKAILIP